jgi:predicted regulator of amino acid metabolism with ACT domain
MQSNKSEQLPFVGLSRSFRCVEIGQVELAETDGNNRKNITNEAEVINRNDELWTPFTGACSTAIRTTEK